MTRITEKGLVSRYWWIPMLTGLLAIGFGIWCLSDPSQSLPILAYVFAACMCGAGVLNFTFAFSVSGLYSQWVWMIVMLFCTIGFSMIFLVNPVESLYIEWVWLGISLLTYGIYRICFSFAMKRLGKFSGGIL